jgi:hypothetical protein
MDVGAWHTPVATAIIKFTAVRISLLLFTHDAICLVF